MFTEESARTGARRVAQFDFSCVPFRKDRRQGARTVWKRRKNGAVAAVVDYIGKTLNIVRQHKVTDTRSHRGIYYKVDLRLPSRPETTKVSLFTQQ